MQRKRELGKAWRRSCLQTKQFQERIVGAFSNEAVLKRIKEAKQGRLLATESSNKKDKSSPCVPKVSCAAKISVLKPCLKSTNVEYSAVIY